MSRILRIVSTVLLLSLVCFAAPADNPQPQVLKPADNLVTENVPDVPLALVEQARRYGESRAAGFSSWHPTKREMLVITRFGDTWQVHRVSSPGGARYQLTFFPDNVYSGIAYQPTKGDYFVFAKDTGGGEFYQLYRYDLGTGEITLLTDGKSRNTIRMWSNRGDRLAYGSTRRTGNDVDLWVVEPADPKSDHMVCELKGGGWQTLDWSPDDKQILLEEEISANESYLWLADSVGCNKKLLTPKGPEKVLYNFAKFSKDGKGLFVTTDKESEFQRLAYIDLATGKHTYLTTRLRFDVDEMALSWDGATIAFVTNENGMGVLRLMDTRTRKELPAPKLPVGLIDRLSWHKNNRDLAFTMENSRSTPDVYSLDFKTGKVDRWTYSETGGINTADFSVPKLLHWKSFDGLEISGFLYPPSAKFTGKRPVLVDIHGGPEAEFRPGWIGRDNYYLNELGVAIIFPNVRGSSGFGKTFLTLDNGFLRENSYKDIDALLDWIKQQPDLDGDRIMITGGSYGGHMTLAVSTFYSPKIRCSVDIVGISNLATFLQNTSGYRQDLRRVEYGDERDPKMREFLERIAPLNNAEKIKKPMFVIQGYNDPRVPRTEAEQIVATLKKTGTPVWYLMAKDEGHGFGKKKNRDFEFYSTVLFMQEYLLK